MHVLNVGGERTLQMQCAIPVAAAGMYTDRFDLVFEVEGSRQGQVKVGNQPVRGVSGEQQN